MRFEGKRAIVTGSAGAIGGAIARALAEQGASLGLIDIRPSMMGVDVTWKGRVGVFDYVADLSRTEELKRAIQNAIDALGGVDILVNAAGITSFGSAASLEEREWDRVLSINLKGVFFSCQSVIDSMRLHGKGGRIINIGSLLGKNGGNARPWIDSTEQNASGNIAYGISKAGVHALTVYLARELASAKITVNSVAPGPIESAMTATFPDRLRSLIPLGRMGTPQEVASAVLFLASDEAGFITGEILDVNGGAWAD
jgi:NAD(P)-dependent dehydrogenase (short-subunit alcohol dehydrogenase family)